MSGKALLSNRLGCCSQTTSAWKLQTNSKREALRRISREAAARCGEEREFAASYWQHFLGNVSIPVSNRRLAALLGRGQVMTDFDNRLNVGWWALRIGLGVGPIITGIDKYFNKLADWGMYLSSLATKVVPVSATTFMHVIGVLEIISGLIVLSRWEKL